MKFFKQAKLQNNLNTPLGSARIQLSGRQSVVLPVPTGASVATLASIGDFYAVPGNQPVDFPQLQNNAGYQKVILDNGISNDTPLNLASTTTYSASFLINGTLTVNFSAFGSTLSTFNDLLVAIATLINPNPYNSGIAINYDVSQTYLYVYSATQDKLNASVVITDINLFQSLPGFRRFNKPVSLKTPFESDVIPELTPSMLNLKGTDFITLQASDRVDTEILVNFYQDQD